VPCRATPAHRDGSTQQAATGVGNAIRSGLTDRLSSKLTSPSPDTYQHIIVVEKLMLEFLADPNNFNAGIIEMYADRILCTHHLSEYTLGKKSDYWFKC